MDADRGSLLSFCEHEALAHGCAEMRGRYYVRRCKEGKVTATCVGLCAASLGATTIFVSPHGGLVALVALGLAGASFLFTLVQWNKIFKVEEHKISRERFTELCDEIVKNKISAKMATHKFLSALQDAPPLPEADHTRDTR